MLAAQRLQPGHATTIASLPQRVLPQNETNERIGRHEGPTSTMPRHEQTDATGMRTHDERDISPQDDTAATGMRTHDRHDISTEDDTAEGMCGHRTRTEQPFWRLMSDRQEGIPVDTRHKSRAYVRPDRHGIVVDAHQKCQALVQPSSSKIDQALHNDNMHRYDPDPFCAKGTRVEWPSSRFLPSAPQKPLSHQLQAHRSPGGSLAHPYVVADAGVVARDPSSLAHPLLSHQQWLHLPHKRSMTTHQQQPRSRIEPATRSRHTLEHCQVQAGAMHPHGELACDVCRVKFANVRACSLFVGEGVS